MATKFNATTEDMAQEFSVSIATIRLWVKNGHIPRSAYLKAGNTYRFCIDLAYQALLEDEKSSAPEWTVTPVSTGDEGIQEQLRAVGETEEVTEVESDEYSRTGIHALDTDEDI